MSTSGLLILTQPLCHVRRNLPRYLAELNKQITKTAYIHVQPNLMIDSSSNKSQQESKLLNFIKIPLTIDVRHLVKDVYVCIAKCCSNLDVRVLVGHFGNSEIKYRKYNFIDPCDIVLIDRSIDDEETFIQCVREQFDVTARCKLVHREYTDNNVQDKKPRLDKPSQIIKQYKHTVLGGTFDRLHVGHKILLSEGCMLGTSKLTVGVTDGEINGKKTLQELIQPVTERISIVEQFLHDIKPCLEYNVVPITDGYGPTVTEENIDLIVLSEETRKGGEMINDQRQKLGMKTLDEYTIELVEDICHSQYEENKISSSSQRKRLLGTLYNPVQVTAREGGTPYIIGLTGGIASGKSSVCKRLEQQGARIVDCDKLGHKAYVKGSRGFDKLVREFGEQIVGEDGEVDRKQLGKIVFGNKEALQKLNSLVWPEIAELAQQQIEEYREDGCTVIILDAAVLLEAGWESMCHEVWTTIIPQQESVKRMIERNNLTEDQAKLRINAQISNIERVQKSNVVLCTLWEYEFTQQQVEKAWCLLQSRIPKSQL